VRLLREWLQWRDLTFFHELVLSQKLNLLQGTRPVMALIGWTDGYFAGCAKRNFIKTATL
jgi:hypothetical protein